MTDYDPVRKKLGLTPNSSFVLLVSIMLLLYAYFLYRHFLKKIPLLKSQIREAAISKNALDQMQGRHTI